MEWDGLDAFLAKLQNMPTRLQNRAEGIVANARDGAAVEYRQKLPGSLKSTVTTELKSGSGGGVVGTVRNTAPHSHLWDFGTKRRRTARGANRGRMPEANALVPVAERWRNVMKRDLVAMVKTEGFDVSEE